ncbi:MAG TPA: polysaccharide deacetylase family protein [Gammaproteobacteria bacterium]|nr:polysaccharide deacetylase family protein [Gammaproteobacteria bacterium]
MNQHFRHAAFGFALEALHRTGATRLLAPAYAGIGSILMFHRVRAGDAPAFAPNHGITVSAGFLEEIITLLQARGYDIVTMAEASRRIAVGDTSRRFVNLSFDDGYRDTFETAFPVFAAKRVPMTVYLTTGFLDREHVPWWEGLERLLHARDRVVLPWPEGSQALETRTVAQKEQAFAAVRARVMRMRRASQEAFFGALAKASEFDFTAAIADDLLTWDMAERMHASGTVELGAHTVSHCVLANEADADALAEMTRGRERLEHRLATTIRHFAYPFGGRAEVGAREIRLAGEAGFATAVTTRHGNLQREHRGHPHALPRISVNGFHQSRRELAVLLSGAPSALENRLRRVVTL